MRFHGCPALTSPSKDMKSEVRSIFAGCLLLRSASPNYFKHKNIFEKEEIRIP